MIHDGFSRRQNDLIAGALAVLSVIVIGLQSPRTLHAQTNKNATYTGAQASAGKAAYLENCATCHGQNTDDGEFAPPLKGSAFLQKYAAKPVEELFNYMTGRMPPGNPGRLSGSGYAQIAAFLLQQNGVPPGTAELPADVINTRKWVDAMKELQMDYKYDEIPGATHGSVIEKAMPDIFAFFQAHVKK